MLGMALMRLLFQTISALLSFILLMALYPAVQERGQQELDSLFDDGHDQESRYLTLEDLDRLDYLPLVMKEVLRFACVGPLGKVLPSLP